LSSLLSGASVGPEGALSVLVPEIAAWFRKGMKLARQSALGFDVAALSSSFNGIVGSPLFTAVFATEYEVGGRAGLVYLGWNLLAGVVGFSFYVALGLPAFAKSLAFTPVTTLEWSYFAYALLLGVLGAALALAAGVTLQVSGRLLPRLFQGRVLARALAAGVVISPWACCSRSCSSPASPASMASSPTRRATAWACSC
jgi:hypothetical protein